jgi:hypothetical protein
MKYIYIGPVPKQNFLLDRYMPVAELLGIGPGWAVVKFSAMYVQSANNGSYVIGN